MLVLTPATVLAAGFGELAHQSAIGEPFRGEFELVGGGSQECLRVIRSDINDGIPDLLGATVDVQRRGARSYAVVTKATPVADPVIRVTLEETCSARLRRTYTLLLPMAATIAPPSSSVRTPPSPRQAAPARSPLLLPADLGSSFTLGRDASLNDMARALYPSSRSSRRAFVAATRALNSGDPSVRSSSRKLGAGSTLLLPSPDEIAQRRDAMRAAASAASARTSPAPAAPPVKAAQEPASPPAPRAPGQELTPEPAPSPQTDRLVIMGDSPEASGFKMTTRLGDPDLVERTSDSEREVLRREQALIMALDSQIIARLELSERIERLEALQDVLRAEMAATAPAAEAPGVTATDAPATGSAAVTQTPPTPPPTAPPSVTTPPAQTPAATLPPTQEAVDQDMADWWPYVAGLLVVALLLVGWWQRKRSEAAADDASGSDAPEDDIEPVSPAASFDQTLAPDDRPNQGNDSFDFSHVEWDGPPPAELDHTVSPIVIDEEDMVEEHESAVELADIMMSFGRVQGAAETLAEFIRGNPKKAVQPWIKLLEVYKTANMRGEFDALSDKLNKTFNVKAVTWESFDRVKRATESVEQLPHILKILTAQWMTQECQIYLQKLLRDNRGGTREGFPLGIVDDLLTLQSILEDQLGSYRLSDEEIESMIAASEAAQATFSRDETDNGAGRPALDPHGAEYSTLDFDALGAEDEPPPNDEDTAFQDIFDSQSSTTLDLPDLDFQLDEPDHVARAKPARPSAPDDDDENSIEFERTQVFRKDTDRD